LAVILWWTYTIVSVFLLIAVIYVCVGGCCGSAAGPGFGRPSRRRRGEGFRDMFDRSYSDAFDRSLEFEVKDVPGRVDPRSIPHELPIEIITGISTGKGGRLREIGIEILLDLADGEPEEIARVCETELSVAQEWKTDAMVIIYGGEVEDLIQLGTFDSAALKVKIDFAIETREIRVPAGYEASEKKIREWIAAAKDEMTRLGIDDEFFEEP
jgi:hypothetical protein